MLMGTNEEYETFVDKFKPKLTTDDCYTPENVYTAVRDWVIARYNLPKDTLIIRPFWPGADYQAVEYPEGCVVIDNPPFSIVDEIEKWFLKKKINFFLFAPALTIFKRNKDLHYVLVDVPITYANGAKVATSFVTNMGECLVEVSSGLHKAIEKAEKENSQTKPVPKYELPMNVATSAKLRGLAKYGVDLKINEEDAVVIRSIESMKRIGKEIYGKGLLLGEKAAAKKAEAEREAAIRAAEEKKSVLVFELSEAEKKAVKALGK